VVREPEPEEYNTPLTRWDHAWRFALALVITGLSSGEIAYYEWKHDSLWSLWLLADFAGGVVAYVLVTFRRRWPFPIAVVLTLFGLFSSSAAGAGALAAVSLATRRNLRQIIPIGILSIACGQLFTYYQPTTTTDDPPWLVFTFIVAITVALLVFGMYVGSRRELLWTLRERARQAEAEQELRVGRAQSAERERIAREMHDVLAHRISLVTMHAGALAYRTDLTPVQVRETAQLIQTKAHEALTDLRQVLGMLRGEDGVPDRPQPTLLDLDTLMEEARTSGMLVDYTYGLANGTLPSEQVGRTVYRIVQEALTNARKHAAGTRVWVSVDGGAERGLTVTVANGKPVGPHRRAAPGSGLGLVGLRERTELSGGTLSIEETAQAFALRGWLPWT
jgi:signal transduction histidine kinase